MITYENSFKYIDVRILRRYIIFVTFHFDSKYYLHIYSSFVTLRSPSNKQIDYILFEKRIYQIKNK